MMPAAQFQVTSEWGTYLCTARALVFEGIILAYNPTLNEAEWIPMRWLANDLSWGEKRPAVALANYVPHVQKEGKRIAGLRVSRVVDSPDNDMSTTSMEEEEESGFSDAPSMGPQMDMDCEVDMENEGPEESEDMSRQKSLEEDGKDSPHIDQHRNSRNWESIMEGSEVLAFDDPHSGSDTTIMGVDSPSVPLFSPHDESGDSLATRLRGSAPHSPELPMEVGGMLPLVPMVTTPASGADTVEVHVPQSELDNL